MQDKELYSLLIGVEQTIQNMLASMGMMGGMGPDMGGAGGMY